MIDLENLEKEVRRLELWTKREVADRFAGTYRSAFKGQGIELHGVREYIPGDDVRAIDWHVTARLQTPHSKIFSEERECTVFLVVDISRSGAFGSSCKKKEEVLRELCALLAFSAFHHEDRIALLLYSDRIEKYVPPRKGRTHVLRVIRDLLYTQPRGSKTNLQVPLDFLARFGRRTICFLMSDFISCAGSEMGRVAKHHDLIAVSVVDPKELDFPNIGLVRMRDLETGQEDWVDTSSRQVRKALSQAGQRRLRSMRRQVEEAGGRFVDIRTDVDPFITLRQALLGRVKRG